MYIYEVKATTIQNKFANISVTLYKQILIKNLTTIRENEERKLFIKHTVKFPIINIR